MTSSTTKTTQERYIHSGTCFHRVISSTSSPFSVSSLFRHTQRTLCSNPQIRDIVMRTTFMHSESLPPIRSSVMSWWHLICRIATQHLGLFLKFVSLLFRSLAPSGPFKVRILQPCNPGQHDTERAPWSHFCTFWAERRFERNLYSERILMQVIR